MSQLTRTRRVLRRAASRRAISSAPAPLPLPPSIPVGHRMARCVPAADVEVRLSCFWFTWFVDDELWQRLREQLAESEREIEKIKQQYDNAYKQLTSTRRVRCIRLRIQRATCISSVRPGACVCRRWSRCSARTNGGVGLGETQRALSVSNTRSAAQAATIAFNLESQLVRHSRSRDILTLLCVVCCVL